MERYIYENLSSKYFSLLLFVGLMNKRNFNTSVTNIFRMSRLDPAWTIEMSEGQIRSYIHRLFFEHEVLERSFDFDISENPRNRSAYTYYLSKRGKEYIRGYIREGTKKCIKSG